MYTRGDIVLVTQSGDYGKPRPALVTQCNELNEGASSIIVALVTTHKRDASLYRLDVSPDQANGLLSDSQIQVEKLVTIPQDKVRTRIGQLAKEQLTEFDRRLAFVVGLA